MFIFVFAQLNAIPCIGEQDKRLMKELLLFCSPCNELHTRAKQSTTIGIHKYS